MTDAEFSFGSHSLRRGLATSLLAAGVSPQRVQAMGDWHFADWNKVYGEISYELNLLVHLDREAISNGSLSRTHGAQWRNGGIQYLEAHGLSR